MCVYTYVSAHVRDDSQAHELLLPLPSQIQHHAGLLGPGSRRADPRFQQICSLLQEQVQVGGRARVSGARLPRWAAWLKLSLTLGD